MKTPFNKPSIPEKKETANKFSEPGVSGFSGTIHKPKGEERDFTGENFDSPAKAAVVEDVSHSSDRKPDHVKITTTPKFPNPEKQKVIDEHGGQISNIPINHPYWGMPDTIEKDDNA